MGGLETGRRIMLAFNALRADAGSVNESTIRELVAAGFTRGLMVSRDQTRAEVVSLLQGESDRVWPVPGDGRRFWIIADRLVAGKSDTARLIEGIETCFREGSDRCTVLCEWSSEDIGRESVSGDKIEVDGKLWLAIRYSSRRECVICEREFQKPEPRSLSFLSPAGACFECAGRGAIPDVDWNRLVPDPKKSLEEHAIVLLSERRWRRQRQQILALCEAEGIGTGRPFRELDERELTILREGQVSNLAHAGVDGRRLPGLRGLFQQAERQNRASLRDDLVRWAPRITCAACGGDRLRRDAIAIRLRGGDSISDVGRMSLDEAMIWLQELREALPETERKLAEALFSDLESRFGFLIEAGLGYLQTGRAMSSLSLGEARRVNMVSVIGTGLVNTLFVLDEPSAGQHPRDCERLLQIVRQIRDSGNTVVVVEHQPSFIAAADYRIELGPGAGGDGGLVTFFGVPSDSPPETEDSRYARERCSPAGHLRIENCTHHTLQNVSVEIPLGCLCVVTGVSGAGKSSLIEQTLYPALCDALHIPCSVSEPGSFDQLAGDDRIGDVQLVSAERLTGGRRSNVATWLKLFDAIRQLFAETQEAVSRNLTAATFSFNTESGGRCRHCRGTGSVEIDMQFLSDVVMTCPECHGTRYQRGILDVTWRGRSIADVLEMTAEEAFSFFRGQSRIQKKLQSVKEVGLGYLRLGQPLSTLSGGEAQRLKLASSLAATGRTSSLLILSEPATGLHPSDTDRLLQCFDRLLAVGHSLLVVEHNLQVIRSADHIIELGPEAGPGGGQVVATGSVEKIRACPESLTGRSLGNGPGGR